VCNNSTQELTHISERTTRIAYRWHDNACEVQSCSEDLAIAWAGDNGTKGSTSSKLKYLERRLLRDRLKSFSKGGQSSLI
jgi:hypothetical protein